MRPRVAVVGGGIAGIAAALDLVASADVTLFEATDRLGGPVRTVDFAGTRVETGPDSFLARRPEMIDLATRLGFGDSLTSPAATEAGIWSRGAVRKMPTGLVLGVPRSLKGLAESGIVSRAAIARAALDRVLPPTKVGDDIGMGDLVQRRFGRAVQQRLVDALMGGVHAGRSELLSTAVAAPQLLAAARTGRSLMASLPEAPPSNDPVFFTVPTGLGDVIDAAAKHLPDIRCNSRVDELRVVGDAWEIKGESFDGVVIATHAPVTARLVEPFAPDAADALTQRRVCVGGADAAGVSDGGSARAVPPQRLPGAAAREEVAQRHLVVVGQVGASRGARARDRAGVDRAQRRQPSSTSRRRGAGRSAAPRNRAGDWAARRRARATRW